MPASSRQPGIDERPRGPQFSLRRLWFWITALCIVLGVPGGYVLLMWMSGWFLISVAILGGLLLIQAPVFMLLQHWIPRDDR